MKRLLVVGAGATIEECQRSGNRKNDPDFDFPTIKNFCKKLFNPISLSPLALTGSHIVMSQQNFQDALLEATSSYLRENNISFDSKIMNLHVGDSFSSDDIQKSPIAIFQKLEEKSPDKHNIESLSEHVWNNYGSNQNFWEMFIYNSIYFKLFTRFTEQFGLGLGVPMLAGIKVAEKLVNGDIVINLNYDIAFDLGLTQAGKNFHYAPKFDPIFITILKPHGSFNLYSNSQSGNFFFEDPDKIRGSICLHEGNEIFSPYSGILPPRLNKSYDQHPIASYILKTGRPFAPETLTFWGVGLTDSDIDLLDIYKEASKKAKVIEFINPSKEALEKAKSSLNKDIAHFSKLEEWLEQANH